MYSMPPLYEIPEPSRLRVTVGDNDRREAVFDHIDGMFSYCYLADDETAVFHLSASTPMKLCDDGVYEIAAWAVTPETE